MSAPRVLCGRLLLLSTRRIASPVRLVCAGLLGLALAGVDWVPGDSLLPDDDPITRGLARQAAWSLALIAALPALTLAAARVVRRWRGGEGAWLVSHPVAPRAVVGSVWAGVALGAALLGSAFSAGLEIGMGDPFGSVPRLTWARSLEDPPRIDPGGTLELTLNAPPSAGPSRVRVRLRSTYGEAPTGEIVLSASREGTGPLAEARAVQRAVAGRTWLEVGNIAGGEGPVLIRLHNRGPGAVALQPGGTLEIWTEGGRELEASFALGLRAWVLLCISTALALWLGLHLASGLAALFSAATMLVILQGISGPLTGDALLAALEHASLGRVPAYPGAAIWLMAAGVVPLALALTSRGLRRGGVVA